MLEWMRGMTSERFHQYICRGICSYMVLHVVLMYIVQFGLLDYFAVNVLQVVYMLAFLFVYAAAVVSKQVALRMHAATNLLVLFLAWWGIVSTCFAADRDIALYGADTRNEGLFAWFAYYLLFYCASLLSKKERRICLWYFSGLGLLALVTGIVFSYTGLGYLLSGRIMAYAPLLHQNMYAGFAVLYFGLHLGLALFSNKRKETIYAICATLVAIAAIICSTSSLGMVSAVFILVVLLAGCLCFDRGKGAAFWKRVLGGCLIFVLAAIVFIPVINMTNGQLLSKDVQSNQQMIEEEGAVNGALNGRLDHWMAGIRALPEYWLTGVGIDNYKKILNDYDGFGRYRVSTAHNEYIQLALTEGVLALACYLCLLGILFWTGIRRWKEADWMQRGLFLAFMGYICQAFVSFSSVAVAPFFWMVMGMLSSEEEQ